MTRAGRIYVDLDDVLSHTIEPLLALLARLHGRRVELDDVREFDLGRSFDLAPDELDAFMRAAHAPELLARLEPVSGSHAALAGWLERGYAVAVVTGRPPSTEAASREWLGRHAIPHSTFACVDKYARPGWNDAPGERRALAELAAEGFSLAVEDSLAVAAALAERGVPVALVDRPWNRDLSALAPAAAARIERVGSWHEIAARFARP